MSGAPTPISSLAPAPMTYGDLLHQLEEVRKTNPDVLDQPITIHHGIDDGDGGWCLAVRFCFVRGQEPSESAYEPHCGWSFEDLEDGRFYMLLDDL